MSNNALKSIGDLKDYHFYVEDYQRGYKWTDVEVNQLLDDINEFKDGDGFYCLQPLVIKYIDKIDSKTRFEIIDGQQRVTTIFLILTYLQATAKFEITYRTRKRSEDFLKKINTIERDLNGYKCTNEIETTLEDNIDNYHFFEAYDVIQNWFVNNLSVSKENFLTKLYKKVQVIWYEIPISSNVTSEVSRQESVKIFTRINSGKIPLTNGELIKALFLINVEKGKNAEILQLKQNEIAYQWDNIESTLQNEEFWYFISNDSPPSTRIDFIFELITGENYKQEKLFTFLEYQRLFKEKLDSDKGKWVQSQWEEVHNLFLILKSWYENKEIYHLIGFLLTIDKSSIKVLINANKNKNKIEFLAYIQTEIKKSVELFGCLENLDYPDKRYEIKIILLLFNILTVLKNDTYNKFPFNKYKKDYWDIEHIHSQESIGISSPEDWITWRNETVIELKRTYPNDKIINEIIKIEDKHLSQVTFDNIFKSVIDFYMEKDNGNINVEINDLSNLALLDAGTNRSYKNAIFPVKRKKIAKKDEDGRFIPICTKNVFLKYYSEDLSQMFLWTRNDRKDYLKNMKATFKTYNINL